MSAGWISMSSPPSQRGRSWRKPVKRTVLPVLVVVVAIVAFWYLAAIPMNIREVLTEAERAGAVVNGGDAGFGEWPMKLRADHAVPLRGGRDRPLTSFGGHRVHAVAGIGNPQRFFEMLRSLGIGVVPHAFDDHHHYTADDLAFGSELSVLMTEKDAVKCVGFASDWHYSVPVTAELPEAFWVALLEKLGGKRVIGS